MTEHNEIPLYCSNCQKLYSLGRDSKDHVWTIECEECGERLLVHTNPRKSYIVDRLLEKGAKNIDLGDDPYGLEGRGTD